MPRRGLYARALGHSIFTEAETWDELRANVLEAVSLYFEDATPRPRLVQMQCVKVNRSLSKPHETAARRFCLPPGTNVGAHGI